MRQCKKHELNLRFQEEEKDVLDVSYKFRGWINIKFIKSRDNIPEWRW